MKMVTEQMKMNYDVVAIKKGNNLIVEHSTINIKNMYNNESDLRRDANAVKEGAKVLVIEPIYG